MARINEAHERLLNGYGLNDTASNTNSESSNNNCINYNCSGNFWIPLKEFESIIYSDKFGTHAGKIKVKNASLIPYASFFWRNTIAIVDRRPKTINYPKKGYLISDQFEADVDAYVTYQIVDAKKYYEASQNVLEELNQKVQGVLRGYFVLKGFTELSAKTTSLQTEIGSELNQAISNMGIKITDVGYTECKLPKSLIDDAEQKKVQELAHTRQRQELAFQQNQIKEKQKFQNTTMDPLLDVHAQNEARRTARSDTTKLKALRKLIKDLPPEQQAEILKSYMYASSPNGNIHIVETNPRSK